jgi:hypothetical protein
LREVDGQLMHVHLAREDIERFRRKL